MTEICQSFLHATIIGSFIFVLTKGSFNYDPLMDGHPYSISWKGPLELSQEEAGLLGERHVVITTSNKERYQCILPETQSDKKESGSKYTGPTATTLLQPMFQKKECSYRIESYWTYELCHGKHLKQYHGAPPNMQEYYLGFGNHRENKEKNNGESVEKEQEEDTPIPVTELDGESLPYYEVIMSDGTKCDLTNQPRKTHVLYVCIPDGRGEVYEFNELSTCEYEVIVLTKLLCQHPDYRPKKKSVNEIDCHAIPGSPIKPSSLLHVEKEARYFQSAGQDFTISDKEPVPERTTPKPKAVPDPKVMFHRKDPPTTDLPATQPPPPTPTLGALTDRQTLKNFFSGRECLRGGRGWWKHEICYGKHVKQFHVENGREISIYLGFWDKQKHLHWLNENPLKRPKDLDNRKHVSLHYAKGDTCDLNGKPRTCEVRLKCIENSKNPHAVMLSLAEPTPCQYVLTVDSALFCPLMKHANKDGIIESVGL